MGIFSRLFGWLSGPARTEPPKSALRKPRPVPTEGFQRGFGSEARGRAKRAAPADSVGAGAHGASAPGAAEPGLGREVPPVVASEPLEPPAPGEARLEPEGAVNPLAGLTEASLEDLLSGFEAGPDRQAEDMPLLDPPAADSRVTMLLGEEEPSRLESVDFFSASLQNVAESLDGLLAEVMDEELSVETAESACGAEAVASEELPEMREMFGNIAAVYVRPVRQFLSLLKAGPVSRGWVDMCLPAVGMVARSARTMGLESVGPALGAFELVLRAASGGEGATVEGEAREAVLEAAGRLARALPEAFGETEECDHRDTVILLALLRQIPDVGSVTLDKIFGAGLTSIEMLSQAGPTDLSATTGVPPRLSERICLTVQEYRAESRNRQVAGSPATWLQLIGSWVGRLQEGHDALQRLADANGSGESGERRRHRRSRQEAALKLDVLLAEMGEVQLVDEVQRLSFDRRIERLCEFLVSRGGEGEAAGAPVDAIDNQP